MLTIRLIRFQNGWFEIELTSDKKTVPLDASYAYDTPDYLLKGINELLTNGTRKVKIFWEDESDASLLVLERKKDLVEVTVLYDRKEDWGLDEHFHSPLDEYLEHREYEVTFSEECDLYEFSAQIQKIFQSLLETYGLEGYKEVWEHPFSELEYNKLSRFINTIHS